MSKNAPTIEQLNFARRHVLELIDAGMAENLAIRSLEIYANVYAKYRAPHPIMQTNMRIGPRLHEKPKLPIPIDLMGDICASSTVLRDDTLLDFSLMPSRRGS